tara:strand:+ start:50483 stop:51631 length:1149 start_codon:yes stop_codon:yes gene_type:complete
VEEIRSTSWTANLGPEIHFGCGVFDRIGALLEKTGKKRFLIVCGSSAVKNGWVETLKNSTKGFAESLCVYSKISQDPSAQNLKEIIETLRSDNCDGVIGLGGGSPMDAAKAASVIAPSSKPLEDYLSGKEKNFSQKIFSIAIPTTAGTGAELSQGAIITWEEKAQKVGVRGSLVKPDLAVVDPRLTLSVPKRSTQITGFDVFTHAVETYISKKSNPIVETFSRQAIRGVARYLPRVLKDLDNLNARTQMSYYSMLMGYNLANSSTCLPHRLQYPLGVKTQTEHAFGLAALYPSWVKTTHGSSPEKFQAISQILSDELGVADEGIEFTLKEFLKTIGLEPNLSSMDLTEADAKELASLVSGSLDNDPWWSEGKDLVSIYTQAL